MKKNWIFRLHINVVDSKITLYHSSKFFIQNVTSFFIRNNWNYSIEVQTFKNENTVALLNELRSASTSASSNFEFSRDFLRDFRLRTAKTKNLLKMFGVKNNLPPFFSCPSITVVLSDELRSASTSASSNSRSKKRRGNNNRTKQPSGSNSMASNEANEWTSLSPKGRVCISN